MRRENLLSPHALIAAGMLSLAACARTGPEGEVPVPVEPISEAADTLAKRIESNGTGICNFDESPEDLSLAALNEAEYREGAMCGACVEVVGPNQKPVVARVVDRCYWCAPEQLGLSKQVFDQMGASDLPQTAIRWRYVTCPVTGPVQYLFKEGSSAWWAAIQVRNHLLPIQKLEWQKDGAWVELPRTSYNYFVQDNLGPGPVRVRVTASDGQQLEDTLPEVASSLLIPGAAQFQGK
jgi:expansin (peptidoglycan-binding protein)